MKRNQALYPEPIVRVVKPVNSGITKETADKIWLKIEEICEEHGVFFTSVKEKVPKLKFYKAEISALIKQ